MLDILDRMAKEHESDSDSPENESGGGDHRTRLIIDSDETLNAAVQLRASKMSVVARRRVSKSEAVAEILRDALAEEIAEIARFSQGPKRRK